MPRRRLRPRHFVPLAGFLIPTVAIGYGAMIPNSCIAGLNELSVGFAGTLAGACMTYWLGLRAIAREEPERDGEV